MEHPIGKGVKSPSEVIRTINSNKKNKNSSKKFHAKRNSLRNRPQYQQKEKNKSIPEEKENLLEGSKELEQLGEIGKQNLGIFTGEIPCVQISSENLLRASGWTANVAHKCRNAVVKILASVVQFDWEQPYRRAQNVQTIGSGFFVSKDGLIATNAHVVEGAAKIWITVPSEGEQRFDAEVLGVCFDADLALLKAINAPVECFLQLGDSDKVLYGQEVLTLGYPLGMESLKLTVGIISGRQEAYFQTDAPLNPGNSGGPMLNEEGRVIGINVAIVEMSQNVGFAIPSQHLSILFEPLKNRPKESRVIHKPLLGAEFSNCSEAMLSFKDSPVSSGVFIRKAYEGFPLFNAGVRDGDLLHSFNGFQLDNFGDAKVPWSTYAKENIDTLATLMDQNSKPEIEWSHQGEMMKAILNFQDLKNPGYPILPSIREYYPPYEKIDFEVIGGLVIMQLTLNHISLMHETRPSETVIRFLTPIAASFSERLEPALVISNVLLGSLVDKQDIFEPGTILTEVNGIKVQTLEKFREAILSPIKKNGDHFITFISKQNELAVVPLKDAIKEEFELSEIYMFNVSKLVFKLLELDSSLIDYVVGKNKKLRSSIKSTIHAIKKEEETNLQQTWEAD